MSDGDITFIPVRNSRSWSSNAEIYIDYIGFFDTEEQAATYSEADDDDYELLTVKTEAVTATGSAVKISAADYVSGYSKQYFKPDISVSRAEAAAMLSRVVTADMSEDPVALTDISEDAWYYDDVKKLSENGVVESEGEFRPNDALTRRELARMLNNLGIAAQSRVNNFSDVSVDDADFAAICAVSQGGLIIGDEYGRFLPDNAVTRAQIVAVINRVLGVDTSSAADKVNNYVDLDGTHWAYLDIMAVTSAETAAGGASSGIETINGVKYDTLNSQNKVWEPILMRSQDMKDRGITGGEGAQYQTHITTDSTGQYIATFSDAGQIYVSKDYGETWNRGGRGVDQMSLATGEFDPNNSKRILGFILTGSRYRVGQEAYEYLGDAVYLSEDYGDSFEPTSLVICDEEVKHRAAFAWDASSYDDKIGGSSIAYFTTNKQKFAQDAFITANQTLIDKGYNEGAGLYRSDDGGRTWKLINDRFGGTSPAVCPANGTLFIAATDGLWKSKDHGENFEKVIDGAVTGVCTILTHPQNVYACNAKGIYISEDCGETFRPVTSGSYPANAEMIRVSPANPDRIIVSDVPENWNNCGTYVSHDGGANWTMSVYDTSDDFYTHQHRPVTCAWSPIDEDRVWTFSDWVESSRDGGYNFKWDANGQGSSCIQAPIVPNVYNPNIWMATAQDYGGAVTFDNGDTWQVLHTPNWYAGDGKAHIYGGYAVDENTWFVTTVGSWEQPTQQLMLTRDGGKTWKQVSETSYFRTQKALQSQVDPNVWFATNMRSEDAGENWHELPYNIRQVDCYNPKGTELFGHSGSTMYKSVDTGKTWTKVCDVPEFEAAPDTQSGILLSAYDWESDILYIAQCDRIYAYHDGKVERVECEPIKNKWITVMECDPTHPNVIYVCGTPNGAIGFDGYTNLSGIIRSCDSGKTWQVISSDTVDETIVKDGPVVGIIPVWAGFVHSETGDFVVGQPNYGLAKFPAPYEK